MEQIVFLLVAAIILFIGAKTAKKGMWHEDFLSLSVSKSVLGICALLIIMHHCSQTLAENAGALAVLEHIGVCLVGMFFVFSGYGLMHSLIAKENYLESFFIKRYLTILIPFYLIHFIFVIFYFVQEKAESTLELIELITGVILINTQMWYVVEIALFYALFFIIFRFCKNKKIGIAILFVMVSLITVGSLFLGHGDYWFQGEWWYNTSLLFVLGVMLAYWEEPIVGFARKYYKILLSVSIVITTGLCILTNYLLETYSYWSEFEHPEGSFLGYRDKLYCLASQLPFVIFFVITMLLIGMKLQCKNKILDFLGKISLELYLLHNLFILTFTYVVPIENRFIFTGLVLVCGILFATPIHILDQKIIKLLQKK